MRLLPILLVLVAARLLLWPLAYVVLVPLGWVRSAYVATRASWWPWHEDLHGGATFTAAWALHHQRTTQPADVQWLTARLAAAPVLTPAALATHGLLAAARGNLTEARAFLHAVPWFDTRITPRVLVVRTTDWLVAEAAARGDWAAVERLTPAERPTSTAARVAGAIARRLLGRRGGPGPTEIRSLRDLLPAHQQPPIELVERCDRAPRPSRPGAHAPHADPLEVALGAHIALLKHPTAPALRHATDAWASVLTARATDPTTPALRASVEAALAQVARDHQLLLAAFGESDLGDAARADRREELITAVEVAARSLQDRLEAQRALSPLDEAREWLALASLYRQGVAEGGEDVRRVTFRTVYEPLTTLSVELFNDRDQRWLSNAITRWLLHEAHLAQDQAAIDLQRRNLGV